MQPDQKNIDDLEYLSQRGFEHIPSADADFDELTKMVRKRTFSYNSAAYFSFISLIVGIFIGISVFFAIYKAPISHIKLINMVPQLEHGDQRIKMKAGSIRLDTVVVEKENFERRVSAPVPDQNNMQAPTDAVLVDSVINIPSQGIDISATISQPVREEKIKFIINAPVFYLHDLKITNYATLYFKKNQFVRVDGTSAIYANKTESNQQVMRVKESADYFLHKELADAMLYFKKGQFDLCINSLNLVSTFNEQDLNCDFYLGMCYYHKKNYKKALQYFEACIGNQNNTFLQEATYYKALSLFSAGEKTSAIGLFKQIVEEGEFYSEKAKNFLSGSNE